MLTAKAVDGHSSERMLATSAEQSRHGDSQQSVWWIQFMTGIAPRSSLLSSQKLSSFEIQRRDPMLTVNQLNRD